MNDLYCSLASAGQIVQVPVGSQFVCLQCGKELAVPLAEKKRHVTAPVLIALGGLVVGAGALMAAATMIGSPTPAGHAAAEPPPASQRPSLAVPITTAESGMAPAALAPPKPMNTQPDPGSAASAAFVVSSATLTATADPGAAATIVPVTLKVPAPIAVLSTAGPPPVSVATTLPPPRTLALPKPAPAMQLAMLQTPSQTRPATADAQGRAKAAAEAKRVELAQAAADRQKRKQLLQAQEQERKMLLAKAEAEAAERKKQEDTARATQEAAQQAASRQEAADAAAKAALQAPKPAVKLAAAPAGPTRGFSPRALSGGAPAYPSAYETEGRPGRVTVACLITGSGAPAGCHVVSSQGGVGFNNAALSWLRNGEVRFAPILRNGKTVSEEHSWSISFQP